VFDPHELVKKFEIDKLTAEQRISLIDAIWRSIDAHAMQLLPTPAQIAAYEKHMDALLEDDFWDSEEDDLFVFPRDTH
jgi:putative addiction module component (TIGR02574 family)